MLGNINLSLARRTMLRQLGWAADYDGATENLQITNPKNIYSGEYSLKADFSGDVVGQAPAGWTVGSGAYQVKSTDPSPFGGSKYLECTANGIAYMPCNQAYGRWSFDLFKSNDNNVARVGFHVPATVDGYSLGYSLAIQTDERIVLEKNGSGGTTFSTRASYVQISTYYHFDIYRLTNGQFSVYISGGSFGNIPVLVSITGGGYGTNPVTDNTYVSSNFFVLDLDQGDRIANISCEYGTGSFDLSGFERILHSGNRDFEVPVTLGDEKIINGTFSNNLTNWNPERCAAAVEAGRAKLTVNAGQVNGVLYTNYFSNITPGSVVQFGVDYQSNVNVGFIVQKQNSAVVYSSGTMTGTGTFTQKINVPADATGLRVLCYVYGENNIGYFDNVSVKEVLSDWQGSGNHSCYVTGEDKKSGSFCLKMISTGAGDVNNCITLPADKILGAKETDKFTIQLQAKGSGILGNSVITDGNFDNDNATWSKETGWTISGGVAISNAAANDFNLSKTGLNIQAGETWEVTFTILEYTGGGLRFRLTTPASLFGNTYAANGTFTERFVATENSSMFKFRPVNGPTILKVDNVTLKKVTQPSITLKNGSKQKTITGISCIPNMATNATKTIFNYEATAAEINQGIKIWANQADVIYLDEISFSQAFDIAFNAWVKTAYTTDYPSFFSFGGNSVTYPTLFGFFTQASAGRFALYVGDIAANRKGLTGNIALNDNKYHLISFFVDRANANAVKMFTDGAFATNTDGTNIGVCKFTVPFTLGKGDGLFPGQSGEFQFVRFNNISLSDFDATKYFKSQIPRKYSGGGALVTLHMKFKGPDDQTFLKDYSPLQQLVTGVNVTRAGDQVRGAYPYYSR